MVGCKQRNGDAVDVSIHVPTGVRAAFESPLGDRHELKAGENSFALDSAGVAGVKGGGLRQDRENQRVLWPAEDMHVSARAATSVVQSNGVAKAEIKGCGLQDWPGMDFLFGSPQDC